MNECRPSFQRSGCWCTTWNKAGNLCACFLVWSPSRKFSLGEYRTERHLASASLAKTRIGSQSDQSLCYFYGFKYSFFLVLLYEVLMRLPGFEFMIILLYWSTYGKQIHLLAWFWNNQCRFIKQLSDYINNNIVIFRRNWPLKVQSKAKSFVRFRRWNRNKKTIEGKKDEK